MSKCNVISCNNEIVGKRATKFCSLKCKQKFHVAVWRKRTKERLVEYKGGSCSRCGYNRCNGALVFHHIDPSQKEFGLSSSSRTLALEKMKKEVDKCILLCANCHAEEHEGLFRSG